MCQACIPDDVPNANEVVPAGLTVVVRAERLIPINSATRAFSSLTAFAAAFISYPNTTPDPMPVMDTPINASFSVVRCQIGRR